MFRHLSFSCFFLAMILPSMSIAAAKDEKIGQVREATAATKFVNSNGCKDLQEQKAAKGAFRQHDCFKTEDGGFVRLQLKADNNIISIGENALVNIEEWVEKGENGFTLKLDVKKALINFDVKKDASKEVQFRTGAAAASIRGTKGVVGGDEKTFFAGLKRGALAVQPNNGDSLSIGAGETVFGREKLVVLKLKSSGDSTFALTLQSILADSTKSLEELTSAVVAADKAYQEQIQTSQQEQEKIEVAESETARVKVPQIKWTSYDSLRCVANVAVSDVQKGTDVNLSALVDGTPLSEVLIKRDMQKRFNLRSGVHEYEFAVENESGRNSVTKTLGCYPMKPFSVKVFGKSYVFLQIPPPPPNVEDVILQTLQFQIRVPEYDPSLLNKVTVRQDGKVILQERLSQIENLDYQIPVELQRGRKNRFVIEVVRKSGYVVKATKVYEVSK